MSLVGWGPKPLVTACDDGLFCEGGSSCWDGSLATVHRQVPVDLARLLVILAMPAGRLGLVAKGGRKVVCVSGGAKEPRVWVRNGLSAIRGWAPESLRTYSR